MNKFNKFFFFGILLSAVAAHAAPVPDPVSKLDFYEGGGSTGVDNVLLNDSDQADGYVVNGRIGNKDTGLLVNFAGNGTEVLSTPSGGQARIEAVDGSFDYIKIYMDDSAFAFGKIIFNIDAIDEGNVDGEVTLRGANQFGDIYQETFALSWNGENWLTGEAFDGRFFTYVEIISTIGMTAMSDLQQVRIGAVPNENPVPEPATMLLFGSGIIGLAALARRKNNV